MAFQRNAPYALGEEIYLRAPDRTSLALTVTAPDGGMFLFTDRATVKIKPMTVGTWSYSWGDGTETFEVTESLSDGPPTVIERVEIG